MVTIKSGYTIAIGGLMTQAKKNNTTKVPILGDLPVLGKLFSNKDKSNEVANLLIFLTATQISYDGQLLYPNVKEVKNVSQKRLYDMGLTNNDLPGEALPGKQEEKYRQLQELNAKIQENAANKKLAKSIKKAEEKIFFQENGYKPNAPENKNYLLPTSNKAEKKFDKAEKKFVLKSPSQKAKKVKVRQPKKQRTKNVAKTRLRSVKVNRSSKSSAKTNVAPAKNGTVPTTATPENK